MMRSKMLDRAEERGEKRGIELGEKRGLELGQKRGLELGERLGEQRGLAHGLMRGRSSCAAMVRLYNEGKDISWVAEATGEEESVVRATLVEAGMLPE